MLIYVNKYWKLLREITRFLMHTEMQYNII